MPTTTLADKLIAFYFFVHIFVTIFADAQVVYFEYYPPILQDAYTWWCNNFEDTLLIARPVWFKSIILCEILLQLPYFFVAVFAFAKYGVATMSTTMKHATLLYCGHVATTLVPIFASFYFDTTLMPKRTTSKIVLGAVYSIFFIVPLLIVVHVMRSKAKLV